MNQYDDMRTDADDRDDRVDGDVRARVTLLAASVSDEQIDRAWSRFERSVAEEAQDDGGGRPVTPEPKERSWSWLRGGWALGATAVAAAAFFLLPTSGDGPGVAHRGPVRPFFETECWVNGSPSSRCTAGASLRLKMGLPEGFDRGAVFLYSDGGGGHVLIPGKGQDDALPDLSAQLRGEAWPDAFDDVLAEKGQYRAVAWFCDGKVRSYEELADEELSPDEPVRVAGASCISSIRSVRVE